MSTQLDYPIVTFIKREVPSEKVDRAVLVMGCITGLVMKELGDNLPMPARLVQELKSFITLTELEAAEYVYLFASYLYEQEVEKSTSVKT